MKIKKLLFFVSVVLIFFMSYIALVNLTPSSRLGQLEKNVWARINPIKQSNLGHQKDIPTYLADPLADAQIGLYSQNAILVDLETNEQLLEMNSEEIVFPASLTKIMTAIVALEYLPSLEEAIQVDADMFDYLEAENASVAGFYPNEIVKAEDLLFGVMLPSGADASIGIANYIAGSESNFVDLMNEKAEMLGMKNTHFMNTTGLHHPNHYSTVRDISILVQYALNNPNFREIFTSKQHSTMPTNMHPEGITFDSTLFRKLENPAFGNGEILGGKTGYTGEAGLCLASLATINGTEYILVTTGARGDNHTEPFHIMDAISVYQELQNTMILSGN